MTEQEIKSYLDEILNTMNDGLFLVRPDGSVMLVNDALAEITGYTREELMNKPCRIFGCSECESSRAAGGEHWCRLFNTRKESRKSCYFRRRDGSVVHVLKNASLLTGEDGEVIGAVETITDITELDTRDRKIAELSRRLDYSGGFHGMIGASPAMAKVYDFLAKAAKSDSPVIIFGESGTGKELAARAIHELGPKNEGPFVQLNCAALNKSLLESELFGHIKGAFTGAYRHRTGRFEEASGGDIFLDEIGDLPLAIQIKLLRVLETRTFERVGDNKPMRLDARLITATNRNLDQLVSQGAFRQDFFFRINVLPVRMPPLRDRREDIPLLADHFLKIQNAKNGKEIKGLTPMAMQAFMEYSWPGNVRELKSAMEYGFVVCERDRLDIEHLPGQFSGVEEKICSGPDISTAPGTTLQAAGNSEKQELVKALEQASGNKSQAARILRVSRGTVLNRMRKYGIDLKKVVSS